MSDTKQKPESKPVMVTERPVVPEGQDIVALLNRGYVCPPDAGPSWRAAAYNVGVDVGLVEDSLLMQPGDRLREHQRMLNQILSMTQGGPSHDPGS